MNAYPTFEISDEVLRKACKLNNFSLLENESEMVLFGIRGALPKGNKGSFTDYKRHVTFQSGHLLNSIAVDYYRPKCVIGQWLPAERKVAVFPGSTVPNLNIVHKNRAQKYQFNCMVPGFYMYKKGLHPKNDGNKRHKALRIDGTISFRRANYSLRKERPAINYGPTASMHVGMPGDNIHCALNGPKSTSASPTRQTNFSASFCMADNFSSYGCQVIVGCPSEYIPQGQANGDWNAWHTFIKNVYVSKAANQNKFRYLLFDSDYIYRTYYSDSSDSSLVRVSHGSSGYLVEQLQFALNKIRHIETGNPYYSGSIDGKYGQVTAQALIDYQKDVYRGKAFGFADGQTFKSFGISLKAIA